MPESARAPNMARRSAAVQRPQAPGSPPLLWQQTDDSRTFAIDATGSPLSRQTHPRSHAGARRREGRAQ
jgi:hypothetical protein